MILIFGGTTEGRLAAEVCEEAGKPFFYSTKSGLQNVPLRNGVRVSGAMTSEEMRAFCQKRGVKIIVDAAHPFAQNLHREIANVGVPVVRLQRDFGKRVERAVYCKSYEEAVARMNENGVQKLLALSGANTIVPLKEFWERHETVFRILDRDESRIVAHKAGLDDSHIIYYNKDNELPDVESEMKMMERVGCDAIITKESGVSGGFAEKVEAAVRLGVKVFVVEHPELPKSFVVVTGKHGLRRMIEKTVPDFFPLKTGFTTGACATAAAKAAMIVLNENENERNRPESVDTLEEIGFELPDGEVMNIPVESVEMGKGWAEAVVVKDWSDDPDVTKGCRILARVNFNDIDEIRFFGGEGVGTVTLPGLGIPVGGPAINTTPRQMMERELRTLTNRGVDVTISVEGGEELAKKTFNEKVGVVGGISIIGTSGIVRPLSNDAFVESIKREMEVAKAVGSEEIGLVSGMKSEIALRHEREMRCVHYGNFVGAALEAAAELDFGRVVIAIMIGKAVKLAEGNLDTHSHKVAMNKGYLKSLMPDCSERIDKVSMARDLWSVMPDLFFDKIIEECYKHCKKLFPKGELKVVLINDKEEVYGKERL